MDCLNPEYYQNAWAQFSQNTELQIDFLFVSQRNSSFDNRYKFTTKEMDNELRSNRRTPLKLITDVRQTNYTYFGARYYDSDLSSWLSVDPLSDKYPSLSPYAYCAGNPVILKDPNGMSIDEWDFNIETGEATKVSTKGGDKEQFINFKYKNATVTKSFETTKEEATAFRDNMSKREQGYGNWSLVGTGMYVSGSFSAIAGGASGSYGNFLLFSNENESFNFSDKGSKFGFDFGASAGIILIFGDKSLEGQDIGGYRIGFDIGAYCGEVGFTTSATKNEIPTFGYGVLKVEVAMSVAGGGISHSLTKVTQGPKPTNYWDRPKAVCFAKGTEIYTNKGYKEIQDIIVGDTVYSYNFDINSIEYSAVTKKYVSKSEYIYLKY